MFLNIGTYHGVEGYKNYLLILVIYRLSKSLICQIVLKCKSCVHHDNLINIQIFNLSRCSTLHELPKSIGQLIALQKLNLSGCSKLQKLPMSIGQLITL